MSIRINNQSITFSVLLKWEGMMEVSWIKLDLIVSGYV